MKNLCFVSLLMIRFYIGTWSAGQGQLPPRQLNFISEETMWLGPRLLHMRTWDWCGSSAVQPMWLCSHWHTFNFFSSWSQFASLGGTYDLLIYMKGREIEIFHLLGHSKKKKKKDATDEGRARQKVRILKHHSDILLGWWELKLSAIICYSQGIVTKELSCTRAGTSASSLIQDTGIPDGGLIVTLPALVVS